MKAFIACAVLFLLPAATAGRAATAELPPELVAAAATSSAEGSSSMICLLDPACTGWWSPMGRDGGLNEGIQLQFREPLRLRHIEIMVDHPGNGVPLRVYLDAKTSEAKTPAATGESSDELLYIQSGLDAPENGRVRFVASVMGSDGSADYAAKSVFIKLNDASAAAPVRIHSIRFFSAGDPRDKAKPIALRLPLVVSATATATSTLEPGFAYDASHLFDSQVDMAWSTNGKTSPGVGESVTLAFDTPQTVGGLMIWNGYQRSATHYKANGRVKRLRVNDRDVAVKDVQGPQMVALPAPVTTDKLALGIAAIYPGGSYKDVLVSELRLLAPDGRILLPQVAPPAPDIPASLDFARDTTFARLGLEAYRHPEGEGPLDGFAFCPDASMRLRSNGGFVIYTNETGDSGTSVVEGGWEVTGTNAVRLFGKKYPIDTNFSEAFYLPDSARPTKPDPARQPRIFQSVMTIRHYADLDKRERANLLLLSAGRTPVSEWGASGEPHMFSVVAGLREDDFSRVVFTGDSLEEALDKLDARLLEVNPVCVVSDVYSDILLPVAKVHTCEPGP